MAMHFDSNEKKDVAFRLHQIEPRDPMFWCAVNHLRSEGQGWFWFRSNHGLDSGEANSQHIDAIIVKEWLSQQDGSILRMQQMY